jgi:hypothetical protein
MVVVVTVRRVDGSLPSLVGEVVIKIEVLTHSFDNLKTDVVRCGATGRIGGGDGNICGNARDNNLCGFLIAHAYLQPFVTAQVIGDPTLAAFVIASYPRTSESYCRAGVPRCSLMLKSILQMDQGNLP